MNILNFTELRFYVALWKFEIRCWKIQINSFSLQIIFVRILEKKYFAEVMAKYILVWRKNSEIRFLINFYELEKDKQFFISENLLKSDLSVMLNSPPTDKIPNSSINVRNVLEALMMRCLSEIKIFLSCTSFYSQFVFFFCFFFILIKYYIC